MTGGPAIDMAPARYGRVAIVLHWGVLLGLVVLFALGQWMTGLPTSPRKLWLYNVHKWIGVVVLVLVLLRVVWRLLHPPPAALPLPRWRSRLAGAVHAAMYVLLPVVPLLGWAYSSAAGFPVVLFGVWPLPDLVAPSRELAQALRPWHGNAAWALAALVALHVAGLLSHDGPTRRAVWARMAPWHR